MKTPCEILWERHHQQRPALDQLRRETIERIEGELKQGALMVRPRTGIWARLFASYRCAWGTLAAIWTAILILQATMPSGGQEPSSTHSVATSPEMLENLRHQRAMLAELLEEGGAADRQRAVRHAPGLEKESTPRTRSDRFRAIRHASVNIPDSVIPSKTCYA